MVTENTVRSVWTAEDEARLQELASRKERIMGERRNSLVMALQRMSIWDHADGDGETLVQEFVSNAEALRDALAPFDSRKES